MLINHQTDGATHGLTLRVRLLGRNLKKKKNNYFFILAKKFVKLLIRSNTVFHTCVKVKADPKKFTQVI